MNRPLLSSSAASTSSPRPAPLGRRYGSTRRHWRRWLVWLVAAAAFAAVHDLVLVEGPILTGEAHGAPAAESSAADVASEVADHGVGGHRDPVAPVLAAIVVVLLLAKIGGDLFERAGMPAVLGELSFGIVLGNLSLLSGPITYLFTGTFEGWQGLEFVKPPPEGSTDLYSAGAAIQMLAGIGVVLLLFEVGLESNVLEMLSVGVSSFRAAVLGVVAPMALGYTATVLVVKEVSWSNWEVPAFVGAALCATSVGITARVLKDLGRSQQIESKIILGAAVIDDVLGLLVLAIVSGTITAAGTVGDSSGELAIEIVKIIVLAVGFLVGALLLGRMNFPGTVFRAASFLRGRGLLVATALVICFGFAWLSNLAGLAPIVGAFAAGLILEGAHYRELGRFEDRSLEEALAPLSALLVPIFFVATGIGVDLRSFANPDVWLLAGVLTVVAIIGKQVCALGVREKGLNRFAVGLGMIPRGEVGLIFANEGRKLVSDGVPVIDVNTYSAIVVMVMITSMVTPPLLKWSLIRGEGS